MLVRRFEEGDAGEVSELIATTLRTTNIRDYSAEYIDDLAGRMRPEDILARAAGTHFYVVCDGVRIVGCGAIGHYWDRTDESCLFTIFVLPEYQGLGVGRLIVRTLERDELFLKTVRTEVPASITAAPFYEKMGYSYKGGVTSPDAEGLLRMEKRR